MPYVLAFIGGIAIGWLIGVGTAGLCIMAADEEEEEC